MKVYGFDNKGRQKSVTIPAQGNANFDGIFRCFCG